MEKEVLCPSSCGMDCPYYKNGKCTIDDPAEECEEYWFYTVNFGEES